MDSDRRSAFGAGGPEVTSESTAVPTAMTATSLAQIDFSAIQTPVLTLDIPRLEANIAATAVTFAAAGVALRPHFKTSKCLQVAARQRDAGAIGFTCSTPAEVQTLTEAGFTDLLWAHQPVGPGKVAAAVDFAGSAGLTIILDSVAVAEPISRLAHEIGVMVGYLLEIDTGQGRTGVLPEAAVELARQVGSLPGLKLGGVITHEGHLSGYLGDRPGLTAAAAGVGATLAAVAQDLRAAGFECAIVSVGSTPGMQSAPFAPGVTEGRPGTYVYYDANQTRLLSCELDQCASSVLTRVVSANRPGTAIIDAGLKAMSADALTPANGAGIVVDLNGVPIPDLFFGTANEEHGFLTGSGTDLLRVGDLLRVIPNHACGTSNMWSKILAVHADGRSEEWPLVARH